MNSILNVLGNAASGGNDVGKALLLQAVGAAMRGEDPKKFMKNLANSVPDLKKVNLDDLMGTANQLAQQKGANIDSLTSELDSAIDPLVKGMMK